MFEDGPEEDNEPREEKDAFVRRIAFLIVMV